MRHYPFNNDTRLPTNPFPGPASFCPCLNNAPRFAACRPSGGGGAPCFGAIIAILQLLANLIAPLKLSPDGRALCYEVMGHAFQKHAAALYQNLLRIVHDAPSEIVQQTHQNRSLEQWLKLSASGSGGSDGPGPTHATDPGQISALTALLGHLTENLDETHGKMPALPDSMQGSDAAAKSLIPGLLARDRIFGRSEDLVPRHSTQSFVVMAEQTGRVNDLDNWVLQSVLEWMDRNAAGMEPLSGLSINLSGSSLTCTEHIEAMASLLARYPHLTHRLILEVTETAAIDNLDVAVRSLRKLRKLGCRVALDDFGSGYSSYSYVRRLPLDYLKIDGTYIRNLLTDKTDQALTASMVDVAHALGLKVIAEYVDSEAVYTWLKDLGVDYVQGYWVHKPERLEDLISS